jgi:hypothetical protein
VKAEATITALRRQLVAASEAAGLEQEARNVVEEQMATVVSYLDMEEARSTSEGFGEELRDFCVDLRTELGIVKVTAAAGPAAPAAPAAGKGRGAQAGAGKGKPTPAEPERAPEPEPEPDASAPATASAPAALGPVGNGRGDDTASMVDINPSLRCNHCLGGLDAREGFFMSSCKHLFCGACGRTAERGRAARPQCNAALLNCPCCETGCLFMELNDMSLRSQVAMRNGVTELVQARSTELMWEQTMEKVKSVESFNRSHNFQRVVLMWEQTMEKVKSVESFYRSHNFQRVVQLC